MSTLVFRKGNRKALSNWTSITPLNFNDKIFSEEIAEWFERFIRKVVVLDQICRVLRRQIHKALVQLRDVV